MEEQKRQVSMRLKHYYLVYKEKRRQKSLEHYFLVYKEKSKICGARKERVESCAANEAKPRLAPF